LDSWQAEEWGAKINGGRHPATLFTANPRRMAEAFSSCHSTHQVPYQLQHHAVQLQA
jgi:hypothetical protein